MKFKVLIKNTNIGPEFIGDVDFVETDNPVLIDLFLKSVSLEVIPEKKERKRNEKVS